MADQNTAKDGKHRRKLSNLLLDKSLQLRYVAFITVLAAIISGSLGYLIWRQEARASDMIMQAFETSELGDPELRGQIDARLTSHDHNLVLTMVGAGAGLVIVMSLFMVVMTHKVAGPLYKVSLYLDQMRDGRLGEVYSLRRFDMLKDFFEKFREAHVAVRARHKDDNEALGRFLTACRRANVPREGELGHLLDEVERYHGRRKEALS